MTKRRVLVPRSLTNNFNVVLNIQHMLALNLVSSEHESIIYYSCHSCIVDCSPDSMWYYLSGAEEEERETLQSAKCQRKEVMLFYPQEPVLNRT